MSGMHGKAGIKRIFLDVAYWPLSTFAALQHDV
jgi:hypothetical protein